MSSAEPIHESPIRIMIAEDAFLIREALVRILSGVRDITVTQTCRDRDGLLAAIGEEPPDVVITDIRMPPTCTDEGIQVARRLRAMLEHLIDRLPPVRTAALRQELDLLEKSVARSFADSEDRRRANIVDFQGLGGSSSRKDT